MVLSLAFQSDVWSDVCKIFQAIGCHFIPNESHAFDVSHRRKFSNRLICDLSVAKRKLLNLGKLSRDPEDGCDVRIRRHCRVDDAQP